MRASEYVFSFVVLVGVGTACGSSGEQHPVETSDYLLPALEFYSSNQLDTALTLLQSVVANHPDDAEAHAWLSETARRLRLFSLVEMETAAALEIEACNSFAHTVLGDAYRPELSGWEKTDADRSWSHYMRAVQCNPRDGNPWIGIWSGAMHRGDHAMEQRALRQLVETGFLTPSVLGFNRWILRSLPENAVLITNGDWDTFPALALQVVADMRRDVAIVNRSLLNLAWYGALTSERHDIDLPIPSAEIERFQPFVRGSDGITVTVSDSIIRGWIRSGSVSGRPLVFAATVSMNAFQNSAPIQYAGAHWKLASDTNAPKVDVTLVRASIDAASGNDFSLPEVSWQDRSAIRRQAAHNRGLARVVLYTGYRYAESMLELGDAAAARYALDWAEAFAADAGLEGNHLEVVGWIRELLQRAAS